MLIKKISKTTQFLGKIVNAYSTKTDEAYSANYANNAHIPIGAGMDYYGINPPENYMWADGSAISRTVYAALFNVIGTQYGEGDGSTTFNLPDVRGKLPVMKSNVEDDYFNKDLGTSVGSQTHTLTIAEMPTHNHGGTINLGFGGVNRDGYTPQGGYATNAHVSSNAILPNQGGGEAFNIVQPSFICNYIIRVK